MMNKIYPRKGDTQTVYLNAVVKDPSIEIGDYTIYNDFVSDPCGKGSRNTDYKISHRNEVAIPMRLYYVTTIIILFDFIRQPFLSHFC